jgi:hypothetical protein
MTGDKYVRLNSGWTIPRSANCRLIIGELPDILVTNIIRAVRGFR